MVNIINAVLDNIKEQIGIPAKLLNLLDNNPCIRAEIAEFPPNISLNSITRWDQWGTHSIQNFSDRHPGRLPGWKYSAGSYSSFHFFVS